ncbi:acyl carrier protein [Candidatus Sumerlaeota bacterium]|nr:acyl carrier protein [Candidatus Sumerlaeota bacterium]
MNKGELLERVKGLLAEEFELNGADLRADSTLYEQLGLDSLDSVDLVAALEKEFGFKVVRVTDEETIRAIRTVSDVCDFVEHKLAGEPSGPRDNA